MNDTNNKKVAKNTIILYIKMAFLMVIGLISSKLTLEYLGAEDYGVYTVVASVVVLFQFLNSALTSGTQRFINYYLGKDDKDSLRATFSQSFYIYIILSIIIIILSETIGITVFNNYLKIPQERIQIAKVVYQLSIATAVFSIIRIPFNSTVIAYEEMGFYAKTSVLENLLKLILICELSFSHGDKLLLYSIYMMLVSFIILIIYLIYCLLKFDIVSFKYKKNRTITKELVTFSWWNIFGSFANLLTTQGNTILVNHYFDVISNAALGLANTVNNAVYAFLSNFQNAFNPQIVKLYAKKENDYVIDYCISTSKYSYMLLYFIILPFIINCSFVLNIVYTEVPRDTEIFVFFLCISTLLDALNGPLWMLSEAEGNIKDYQIASTINGIVAVIVSYVCYDNGFPKYIGLIVRNCALISFMIYKLLYLKKRVCFNIEKYINKTIKPLIVITLFSFVPLYVLKDNLSSEITSFFITCILSCILLFILYWFIALNRKERNIIKKTFAERINK